MAQKFRRFIADCDHFFGAPVSVNFDGKTKFKTALGGCTSILVILIVLIYSTERLARVIIGTNNVVSQYTVYHNLDTDVGLQSAAGLGMDFAVVVYDKSTKGPIELDPSYLRLVASTYRARDDGTQEYSQISVDACDNQSFEGAWNRGNFDTLPAICYDPNGAEVGGEINTIDSQGVLLTLVQCDGSLEQNNCQEQSAIDEYVANLSIEVIYAEQYFDHQLQAKQRMHSQWLDVQSAGKKKPVSILGSIQARDSHPGYQFLYPIAKAIRNASYLDIFLLHDFFVHESFHALQPTVEEKVMKAFEFASHPVPFDLQMLTIQLGLTSKGQILDIHPYTLFQWLRDCGGFTFAILIILYSVMVLYSQKNLDLDLYSSLFKMRNRQQSNDNQLMSEPDPITPDPDSKKPTQLKQRDVQQIVKQMLDQVPLTLPFCLRGQSKKRLLTLQTRASQLTTVSLDIRTIVKKQMRLERIIKVLFGNKQRYLLRVLERKEQLIESDSQEWERQDTEFETHSLNDLYGKLKEINLKTYVGNKLIKALLAKHRDVVTHAAYSVDLSGHHLSEEESYVLRKLSEIHNPNTIQNQS